MSAKTSTVSNSPHSFLVESSSADIAESGSLVWSLKNNNTQSGTRMLWKTFVSVCGERSSVRPFLEPFDFVIIRSMTSEMMPCTFSLSPSVPYKKLFPWQRWTHCTSQKRHQGQLLSSCTF